MTIQKAQNEIAKLQNQIVEIESTIKLVMLRTFDSKAACVFLSELENEKIQHNQRIEKIQNWIQNQ